MTTITIHEDLSIDRNSFENLSELLAYLEQNGLMVVLHEMPEDEVTEDLRHKAEDAAQAYRENPDSFSRL